jgi:CRISPR-associated protein Cas2
MFVVVAYDIADDGRRERLATLLEGYGTRVQESMFECLLQAGELRELLDRARHVIDPSKDNLRLYRLCGMCATKAESWGSVPISAAGQAPLVL